MPGQLHSIHELFCFGDKMLRGPLSCEALHTLGPAGFAQSWQSLPVLLQGRNVLLLDISCFPGPVMTVGRHSYRKGKHGVKVHTVYLATAAAGSSAGYTPTRLDDHHEAVWTNLKEAIALQPSQLHPILAEVLGADHRAELTAAFGVQL